MANMESEVPIPCECVYALRIEATGRHLISFFTARGADGGQVTALETHDRLEVSRARNREAGLITSTPSDSRLRDLYLLDSVQLAAGHLLPILNVVSKTYMRSILLL